MNGHEKDHPKAMQPKEALEPIRDAELNDNGSSNEQLKA